MHGAATPKPLAQAPQAVGGLDRGPRRRGAPSGRAANLVHPGALQRLNLTQWLAGSAGPAHVRSLFEAAHTPGVADSGRAQRQANRLGTSAGHGLAPESPSMVSGPLSAQPGRTAGSR